MVVTNEYGDSAIINARDEKFMEWIARGVTIRMGGAAYIAEYSDERRRREANGRAQHHFARHPDRPLPARGEGRTTRTRSKRCCRCCRDRFILSRKVIWRGKVIDVRRETKMGWALGYAKIEGFDGWNGVMEIQIQNENLIARVDGKVRAIVPDLICIMEAETAEPITTEYLRYGQRVVVVSVAVPAIMRTPEALEVFGPKGFRIDEPYTPIEQIA